MTICYYCEYISVELKLILL